VLVGNHGRGGDVVAGEQLSVAVVRLSSISTMCRRWRVFAEGKPLPVWATTATSTDAVPFLEASLGLLSILLRAPGESPRSPERAVVALLFRALLEDTVLEHTVCNSP
jgi:hypothetical protein